MTLFTDLGLAKSLLKALSDKGYTKPTPIQEKAIPVVLTGRDLLGIAQTGTGKTAAFALPILNRLDADRKPAPRRGCRVLVLSPTRELATQIAESFRAYGAHMGFTVATVFGGVKYGPQMRALAGGVDVLVATPGRLIDHLQEKSAVLSGVEIFVLDEADQMLDMGFLPPIRKIVAHLPKDRQNLFFSATMPTDIARLAGELLKNPAEVSVTPQATTAERVTQQVLFVEGPRKRALLAELFAERAFSRVLVFTRTKRGADRVAKYLNAAGVEAAAIHGDKAQGARERALAAFKAGQVRALVATDIAARGIDVDAVTHVVNYELPNVPEAYVHRIGRTARAGAAGSAISFCDETERALLKDIQKATRQTIPSFDRRNDKSLAAAQAVEGALMGEPRKPQGQGKRAQAADADPRDDVPAALRKQRRRKRPAKGGGQPRPEQQSRRQGESPEGARPQGQRQGDRPQGERNRGPRPEGQRAEGPRNEGRRQEARGAKGQGGLRQGQRQGGGGKPSFQSTQAIDQSAFRGPKRQPEKTWTPLD